MTTACPEDRGGLNLLRIELESRSDAKKKKNSGKLGSIPIETRKNMGDFNIGAPPLRRLGIQRIVKDNNTTVAHHWYVRTSSRQLVCVPDFPYVAEPNIYPPHPFMGGVISAKSCTNEHHEEKKGKKVLVAKKGPSLMILNVCRLYDHKSTCGR